MSSIVYTLLRSATLPLGSTGTSISTVAFTTIFALNVLAIYIFLKETPHKGLEESRSNSKP